MAVNKYSGVRPAATVDRGSVELPSAKKLNEPARPLNEAAAPAAWRPTSSGSRWNSKPNLAEEMDHTKQQRPPMPNDTATRVGMKVAEAGIEVVNALVFPIKDIRDTNLLKERASWDPEAAKKLSSQRTSTNVAMAMAMVPVLGKAGAATKAAVPLAEGLVRLVSSAMVKGGTQLEKQGLLKLVGAKAAQRSSEVAALGNGALANAAKNVAPYWVHKVGSKEVNLLNDALANAKVQLSPAELAGFKQQVLDKYVLTVSNKGSTTVYKEELEAAVNAVAKERWGHLGEPAGFYAFDLSNQIAKARDLRPDQALQLRSTLVHLFETTHEAATALGGPERANQFKSLAENAAKALFG